MLVEKSLNLDILGWCGSVLKLGPPLAVNVVLEQVPIQVDFNELGLGAQ
jgi:hypothetical protein